MPPRLADLVKRARRLATERDRLVDALAAEWTRALHGQQLSRTDLDELWSALTEEAIRRAGSALDRKWSTQAVRQEAEAVLARVRDKVEAELREP